MKVAYLITRMDSIGGAQIHVRDMSLWLKAKGHQPLVVTGSVGSICRALSDAGVEIVEIPDLVRPIRPWRDLRAFFKVSAALRRAAPDLVSCHSSKAGMVGRAAARRVGIPVIFTAHGWAFTDGVPEIQRRIYRALERMCGSLGQHIITVCDHDRRIALEAGIAAADRISTIHNGMPTSPPVVRERRPSGPVNIGMVARFGAQKDHDTLLRALGKLTDKEWRLQLIGGGDSSDVKRRAAELGLADRIDFQGESETVADLMAELDVFCLISRWEGFPRSILEAMRSSLPVIATDVAGVRESVEEGSTGHLIPVGDDGLLKHRLGRLIDEPELRRSMGDAGRRRFEREFTFEHMACPTLDVYWRAMSALGRNAELTSARPALEASSEPEG